MKCRYFQRQWNTRQYNPPHQHKYTSRTLQRVIDRVIVRALRHKAQPEARAVLRRLIAAVPQALAQKVGDGVTVASVDDAECVEGAPFAELADNAALSRQVRRHERLGLQETGSVDAQGSEKKARWCGGQFCVTRRNL